MEDQKEPTVTVTFSMPASMAEWIEETARNTEEANRSTIARKAIRLLMATLGQTNPTPPSTK